MGFWGTLGKIGAGIAAPITGGASLAAIPLISGAESKAGGGSFWKGAASGGIEAALGGAIPGLGGALGGAMGGAAGKAAGSATGGIMSKLGGVQGLVGTGLNVAGALGGRGGGQSPYGQSFMPGESGGMPTTQGGGFGGGFKLPANLQDLLRNAGPLLGKAAEGSAQQRIQETPGQVGVQNANVNAADVAFKNALAGMNARQGLDGAMRKNAMLSAMLGNMEDVGVAKPANSTIPNFEFTGGARPSALTGGGGREALLALLGAQNAGMMADRSNTPVYQGPSQMEMPKAGMLEKGIGAAGLIAQILGGMNGPQVPQTQQFDPRQMPLSQMPQRPQTPGLVPDTSARLMTEGLVAPGSVQSQRPFNPPVRQINPFGQGY